MHYTLNPKRADDPHDFLVVPLDVVRVAAVEQELSKLAQDAARPASDLQTRKASDFSASPPVPAVDATFRPSAENDVLAPQRQQPLRTLVRRTFAALLFAACTGAVALAWQSYGEVGKAIIVNWAPEFVTAPSLLLEKLGMSAQPAGDAAARNETPPQPATVAQAAPDSVAASVAPPAESAPSLQSMARDLANVSQEVVQLRATITELKASQQQISRDVANTSAQNKASVPNAQARLSALPPRPAVPRPRTPIPPFPPGKSCYICR